MKKYFAVLIALFTISFAFAAETIYEPGQIVYVSVKSAKLGKAVVEYGDVLVVDEMAGKKVLAHLKDDENVYGFISIGSVTKKKIIKNAGGSNIRTSSDELSLAGKGFSENAENAFKSENPELNFELVDEIEKIEVSQEDLDDFIQEGDLCAE